jgi:predicted nucleotidyltransferase
VEHLLPLRTTAAVESGVAEDLAAALHNRGAGASATLSTAVMALAGTVGNILTFSPKRRTIKYSVSTETNILIQRAAAELKTAGAREIYVFGSAAKGTGDAASDLDLAVSGLPPSVFYRMGARVSDLIGRSVDLIDLDINTPFTRYLRTENELVRVG